MACVQRHNGITADVAGAVGEKDGPATRKHCSTISHSRVGAGAAGLRNPAAGLKYSFRRCIGCGRFSGPALWDITAISLTTST